MAGTATNGGNRIDLGEIPYGRTRRIEWIKERLCNLDPITMGGGSVAEAYRVMGVLGEHLDRLDSDLGGMAAIHDTSEMREAYQAYHHARERLVEALRTETYIKEIETVLERAARGAGIDTTAREATLWYLDGCHRRGSHAVELATYLTARQIGTRCDHHAIHHSYVPPTFVQAELLVRTPAWVAQYARACDHTAAGECSRGYAITDTECDYVRGLWNGNGNQLERIIEAAKRLARAGSERIAQ